MIREYVKDNKKTIFLILIAPFAMHLANVTMIFIFNIGTVLGTYLRIITQGFIC